jgi:hypothetical protein
VNVPDDSALIQLQTSWASHIALALFKKKKGGALMTS